MVKVLEEKWSEKIHFLIFTNFENFLLFSLKAKSAKKIFFVFSKPTKSLEKMLSFVEVFQIGVDFFDIRHFYEKG